MAKPHLRSILILVTVLGLPVLLLAMLGIFGLSSPVKIGVLTSATGPMAVSEQGVADAIRLAARVLNEKGGVLGHPVQIVQADGASDPETFAREAERLIVEDEVVALFGCWTSASRKEVIPVVEQHGQLLFYPVQYEGLEQSPNLIYLGAAPNQQIIPAVKWAMDHLGRRVFLVGSDYIFPRAAHTIAKDMLALLDGEVVGEAFLPLGGEEVDEVVGQILERRPDVIFNTLNGDANRAFFQGLREAGVNPGELPTMSFSFAEPEIAEWGPELLAGDYAAWNYFMSVDSPENEFFVDAFHQIFGEDRLVNDPMESAYTSVLIWAQAVEDAGSFEPALVMERVPHQSVRAPGGIRYVDGETRHTWKEVRIGRITDEGQFEVVWTSDRPVRPEPFPMVRDPAEWEALLSQWKEECGGRWQAPDETE